MRKNENLENLTEFAERLNVVIGYNPKKTYTQEIVENPSFNECEFKGLLEGYLYVYIPFNMELQKRVKKEISDYVKKYNLKFIVTIDEDCGDNECHGHYVDPFERSPADKHISINEFPEDINGAHVHFLTDKNFQIYEQIIERR